MKRWIVAIFNAAVLIVGITFLSFLLVYLSPSDPAEILLGKSGMMVTDEVLEAKRQELGLNKPMIVQYGLWLNNFVHGDMGVSFKNSKSVSQLFAIALPNTLLLTAVSMLLTIIISTPVGIISAYKKDGITDGIVRAVTYLFISIPAFFLALIFLYVFSLKLKLLPVVGKVSLKGIIMPSLVLSLTLSAWYIRQVRAIILKELEAPYVMGLRSRGISERSILFSHVLVCSLAPLLTLFAMSFGTMLGGSAIVESIFSWNGMGKLAVDAISARDYPVIQAFVVWMAIIFMVINYLVDVLYKLVDPRIRRNLG
ncbi:MAG: ABC transporter permease [Butyrivibrio sp.]|nr:ABC transporter permease [Butyrivibrio sp.]